MTQKRKSKRNGELNGETTELRQGLQSSNAGKSSTSDMSAITAKARSPKVSQLTPNSQENPNTLPVRMILAFVGKLGNLVFWRTITLGNGEKVYALCFPVRSFEIDPVSKVLRPR